MEAKPAEAGSVASITFSSRFGRLAVAPVVGSANDADRDAARVQRYQSGITGRVCAAACGERTAARIGCRRFCADHSTCRGQRQHVSAGKFDQRATCAWRLFTRCRRHSDVARRRSHLRIWPPVFESRRVGYADGGIVSRDRYLEHEQLVQTRGARPDGGGDFAGSSIGNLWVAASGAEDDPR